MSQQCGSWAGSIAELELMVFNFSPLKNVIFEKQGLHCLTEFRTVGATFDL
jgi:hypothetical protein